MEPQIDFFDELIVDNFAGGGGASTGIELATGRVVDIAINHDPAAILMHKTNHPHTEHYNESVWDVDPVELCRGRPVGLAWFSPDCKHFSKAKGSALVNREIRGLAWIVLKWAAKVRPRVIMLENVEEFMTWGPVRKGKPVKKKMGQTFLKWLTQLKGLGYKVEFRTLVAADYGTPTSRKRFFLVARCDGNPIVWPEATHGPAHDTRVKINYLKPYVSAAMVIDWTLPCPSIFDSKQQIFEKHGLKAVRPLANNTMRRIARGLDKFVIKSSKPFIVPIGYGERKGQSPRIHDIDSPLPTEVSTGKHYVCNPLMAAYQMHNHTNAGGTDCREPVNTITSVGAQMLITPSLIQYHSEQSDKEARAYSLKEPLKTADGSNRFGLMAPYLTKYYSGDGVQRADAPMATVTPIDHNSLCMAHIAEFKGQDKGQAADVPLRTITANDGEFGVIETVVVKAAPGVNLYHWSKVRDMLNKHCGYDLKEDEIILFRIGKDFYFIADIGLRMLCPKELYAAMGFPEDYIIDRDYLGNVYKRNKQVARCGNAVCPQVAKALVQANLPEMCKGVDITTMEELHNRVAI